MKSLKYILLIVCVLLLVLDVSWHIWTWHYYAKRIAVLKNFGVEYMHTNGMSGIGIFEVKTEQPLWTQYNFSNDVMESYYLQGHDVFDILLRSSRPPKYSVFFRGPGKSETWWLDRGGSGSFTERTFYDTNGILSRNEVLYDNTWYRVDRRNEKNGLVINGQWHQLIFDTNRNWTIEAVPTNHF
jgi:hypothetical protein